jgi:hypothetical protein
MVRDDQQDVTRAAESQDHGPQQRSPGEVKELPGGEKSEPPRLRLAVDRVERGEVDDGQGPAGRSGEDLLQRALYIL